MQEQYTYERSSDLIKDGDYEVVIEKIERRTLPSNGKEKLTIQYRIRSDVEQSYGNKLIWEDVWQEKENPNFFNRKRINKLLDTQKIKDGTVFPGINAIIDFLNGKFLQIHLTTVYDDYKQEYVNTVSYYKGSKYQPKALGGNPVVEPSVVIGDDGLPF